MAKWAIIVGNGFSMDATTHCRIEENPSFPWSWPIKNPEDESQDFLDVLPRLQSHLAVVSDDDVYGSLAQIVKLSQQKPPLKAGEVPSETDPIHIEACHFLRVAYAWFSLKFGVEELQSWQWTRWFEREATSMVAALSFNYDLVLEQSLRLAKMGILYPWSRQNPLFGDGLIPTEPILYVDENDGDSVTIPIAKPHGSANFSGWGRFEVTDTEGAKKAIFPLKDMFVCRDSTLKILSKSDLMKPIHIADLVLPGEWSSWKENEPTDVEWATQQKKLFIIDCNKATDVLVVGFGCGAPDRNEFEGLVKSLGKHLKFHVVHPDKRPSDALMDLLKRYSRFSVTIWPQPPMPFG